LIQKIQNIDLENLKPEKNKDVKFVFEKLTKESVMQSFKQASQSKTKFTFEEVKKKGKKAHRKIMSILDKKIKVGS
jgi:hypothetical protein